MNSIHDNAETIEKEKQEQAEREEKKLESEDATKAITQNQTENHFTGVIPVYEKPKHILTQIEESQAEKDAHLKKLEEENFQLKKFISENSLHAEAKKLDDEINSKITLKKEDAIDYDSQS